MTAANPGGNLDVAVTSTLADNPGTAAVTSELSADIQVEGPPVALINGASLHSVTSDENAVLTVNGTAVDPNGDMVHTKWRQVSGPKVLISNDTAGNVDLRIPDVSGDSNARLEFTATEVATGKTSKAVLSIKINDKRSSGGTSGLLVLLLLPLALIRRRMK